MIRKQLKEVDCWNNGYPKFYGFVYEIYKDKHKPSWAQKPTGILVFYLIPFDYFVRFAKHSWLNIQILWFRVLALFSPHPKRLYLVWRYRKIVTEKLKHYHKW